MKPRNWLFVFLFATFLLLLSVFLLRKPLLDYAINKVADRLHKKYNTELKVGEAGFMGFRDVYVKNLSLVPSGTTDTLVKIGSAKARIRLDRLLRMQVRFREIIADSVSIDMISVKGKSNYAMLLKGQSNKVADTTVSRSSYSQRFNILYDKVKDIFNENVTVRKMRISYRNEEAEEFVSIPELYLNGREFRSSVVTSSIEGVNLWIINGTADIKKGDYEFSVSRTRGNAYALPFIDRINGVKLCVDEASVKVHTEPGKQVTLKGTVAVKNLLVNHWRIAPEDVNIEKFTADFTAGIADDSLWLNRGTSFVMNKMPVLFNSVWSRAPQRHFRMEAEVRETDSQDFFSSLPEAVFSSLRQIKTTGQLSYNLLFDVNIDNPDSLVFESSLHKKDFRIISYGAENFTKLNMPFSYLAMDGDRPVRSFSVGYDNPAFTPLYLISPYLQNSVLTAEDPSFFSHNGFVEQSFRESISTNIKKGRFVRGGSTISMQLVKNVFLSRNKTIGRKLEEALIVWLIEQNRIVSKERMFEVYLNIIEWGPNVYGIGEASRFYFNKSPMELTLPESIFLASLIPHPKYYRSSFDAEGNLKPFMAGYFKLVAGRLARREKIAQVEADSIQPVVKLTGPALNVFAPVDTTSEEDDFILP